MTSVALFPTGQVECCAHSENNRISRPMKCARSCHSSTIDASECAAGTPGRRLDPLQHAQDHGFVAREGGLRARPGPGWTFGRLEPVQYP